MGRFDIIQGQQATLPFAAIALLLSSSVSPIPAENRNGSEELREHWELTQKTPTSMAERTLVPRRAVIYIEKYQLKTERL